MDRSLRLQIIFNALDKLSGPIRGISGEAKKLTGTMRETSGEIRKLEKTQKTVDQFRQLKTHTAQTGRELQIAREKAERLGRELSQTEKPGKQLTNRFQAARREVEKLEKRLDSQNRELAQTRRNLSDAGVNTRDLARHQRDLTAQVKQANDRLSDQKKKLQQLGDARRRAEKIQALGSAVSGAGVRASVGVTAPLTALGATAFQAATDAVELESAFEVTFGKAATAMKKWSVETGDTLERSTQEMMAMSMAYQDILKKQMDPSKAVEMSKQLTVLTQDLASFKNLSNDVAQQKIFSGLIGEAEPLRAVGVLLSDQAVKAKAAAMGLKKTKGEYSEGAKVQARAALIMEQLADAQGDILRTQDSTSNRLKAAGAAWDELKVKIGQELLPKLTPLIDAITKVLEAFGNLPPGMQQFIVWALMIATALGPVLIMIGGIISVFGALSAAAAALGIGLAPLLVIIGGVILAVAGIAAIGYLIYKHWDKIKAAFDAGIAMLGRAWEWLKDLISRFPFLFGPVAIAAVFISKHWELIKAVFAAGIGALGRFWAWLKSNFGGALALVAPFAAISVFIYRNWDAIKLAFAAGVAMLGRAWETIKGVFNAGIAALQMLPGTMLNIGGAIIQGLANGIKAGFARVKATVSELANILPDWIKRPLGIHSPSRVFMQLGDAIPQGLAAGIDRSRKGPLASVGKLAAGLAGVAAFSFTPAPARPLLAGSAAAPTMGGAGSSAGLSAGGVHIGKIEIHQQPGEDAAALARRVADELERRAAAARRGAYYDE